MELWHSSQDSIRENSEEVVILRSNESHKPSLFLGDTHMKRFILSASLVAIAATTLAPDASANQLSVPSELSETATFHELVLHNRDARNKR